MRIGIVGHGFVGKAVDHGFQRHCVKFLVDPRYDTNVIESLVAFKPDVVFVCVPTPMSPSGNIDARIILETMDELGSTQPQAVVVVKSTVTPNILQILDTLHPHMVYNPEFLSEANALHDFVNPPMLVLGGKQKDVKFVRDLYDNHSICNHAPVYEVDHQTASLVKYCINSFLATKVTFFNGMKAIFDNSSTQVGWDMFTHVVGTDTRVGATHMQVPGPDGKLGFGGACFTKDTAALARYAVAEGVPFAQLESTITMNNDIRSRYELDERELAQKVRYGK